MPIRACQVAIGPPRSAPKSVALTTFSAMAYLFAMAAKEIFVPLVLVLVVIAGLRSALPYAVALAIYCSWRFAVAGPHLESYGWAVERKEWPRLIATLPIRFGRVLSGGNAIGAIALILIVVAILVVVVLRPRSRLLIFVAACASRALTSVLSGPAAAHSR